MVKSYASQELRIIAWFLCVAVVGCAQLDISGHARARSKTILVSICKLIWMAETETNSPPPTGLQELVQWLEPHSYKNEPYIDYAGRNIRDTWHNPIVLISQDGKLVAVGSAGPNRAWEGGKGDDILVKLEEVR